MVKSKYIKGLKDKAGDIPCFLLYSSEQIPWKDLNQQCVDFNNVQLPYPVCGTQPQAHWFILKI